MSPKTNSRRVIFITGTRADYGKLKPLMLKVEQAPELECDIFATGMHMLQRYGLTVAEIIRQGFSRVVTFSNQTELPEVTMDQIVANTIKGLSPVLAQRKPDMLIVHGDRVEALAGAISGSLNSILTIHIEGGEVSGTIDETMRHAISKLSHKHLVSNDSARARLIQMGESKDSIHVIGSPNIDMMLSPDLPNLEQVKSHYEIPFKDYVILMYHPVTNELADLKRNIRETIEGVQASGSNCVVIFPNNDPGVDYIFDVYNEFKNDLAFRFLPSMRFEYFLVLLKNARAIVGNSSCGIHEAPVYGIPTINVGTRQMNRYSHESIHNCIENKQLITSAINKCSGPYPPVMDFGDGQSAAKFMDLLGTEAFWNYPTHKQFVDMDES